MGACMSQPGNSIPRDSATDQWSRSRSKIKNPASEGGGGGGGVGGGGDKKSNSSSSASNPSAVSMSFLKKYSFATVNPAFADFEQAHSTDPEIEEATSRLRSLAQQSFGASSCQDPEQQPDHQWRSCSTSMIDRSRVPSVVDQDEISRDSSMDHDDQGRYRRNRVKFTEEKLVMSSSCMPSYSLGTVINPEAKAKNRRSRSTHTQHRIDP